MKVGRYDIPTNRLKPKLFDATKILYEQFKSDAAPDQLTVARLLGHETDRSGPFLTKLGDLRSYGLITGRGVKVTDLGKKLTYGISEDERDEALKEALLNIPLWKELYSQFGVNLPPSNFWAQLGKITGMVAPDAQKVEEYVRNAYLEDFRYVRVEKEPVKEGITMSAEPKVDVSATKELTKPEELKLGETISLWLPKENIKEAWKKARKTIDTYLGLEEEA